MFVSNVIFPALHDWSILTDWSAAVLIAGAAVFLLVEVAKTVIHRGGEWWLMAILLLMVGTGIWSLTIGLNGYQQWWAIVQNAPEHGIIAYIHFIDATYNADTQRVQIQFAITAALILILLVLAGWRIAGALKNRAGRHRFVPNGGRA